MPSKPGFVRGTLRKFVLPLAVLLAVVSVAADGPVNQIAGVTVASDSDPGSGEQWGRAGGRSIAYTVGNTSAYATLYWAPTQSPSAAFDNTVNAQGEVMTLDVNGSNLQGGVARWQGNAVLPLANQPAINVPTRFTLTVTSNNVPVPLLTNVPVPSVAVDLKLLTTFTTNLRFEAFHNGVWQPLLTFYDNMPTIPGNPPGQGGPVLTSFTHGFYFTNTSTGLNLDQHDANITQRLQTLQSQANSIKDDTAFTRIDAINRLIGVQSSVNTVNGGIDQIKQTLANLPTTQLPNDLATRDDVREAKDNLQEMLMLLFGLMPCPTDPPEVQQMCESATLIHELATSASVDEIKTALTALATRADMQQLGLAVAATNAGVINLEQILIGLSKESSVQEVKAALAELATHNGVEQIKQRLNELGATIDQISAAVGQQAASLASQIVELDASAHRRRWLVSTSVSGAPAAAVLTRLVAVNPGRQGPAVAGDVTDSATVTQLMPGLMEVTIEIDKQKLSDLSFHFSFSHSSGGETLSASSLVGGTKTN